MRCLAFILCLVSGPALAHEFWIEPIAYQVEADGTLEADIVNGEEFTGAKQPFLPQRFVNFMLFAGDDAARVRGRPGDLPALQQAALSDGLNIAAYQSKNATLGYENWEKFQNFVDHKDFGDVLTRHRERGLPEEGFVEVYSRFSKALIGVGTGEGADRRVGLETELVALTNPYTDDVSGGFSVQLYYRDTLRANEQIEVFEKAPNGRVNISLHRTDDNGIGTFPVRPGYEYMVDAVVLREPGATVSEQTGAVWQTLWANLTFAVPE